MIKSLYPCQANPISSLKSLSIIYHGLKGKGFYEHFSDKDRIAEITFVIIPIIYPISYSQVVFLLFTSVQVILIFSLVIFLPVIPYAV